MVPLLRDGTLDTAGEAPRFGPRAEAGLHDTVSQQDRYCAIHGPAPTCFLLRCCPRGNLPVPRGATHSRPEPKRPGGIPSSLHGTRASRSPRRRPSRPSTVADIPLHRPGTPNEPAINRFGGHCLRVSGAQHLCRMRALVSTIMVVGAAGPSNDTCRRPSLRT